MRVAHPAWLCRCPRCGFLASTLESQAGVPADGAVLDEQRRERALRPLRTRAFSRMLQRLGRYRPLRDARLLDVGSAHGWFLDAGRAAGLVVTGVEPDVGVSRTSTQRGHRVLHGLFPQAVPPDERFDVISFHDTLEHFPDPGAAISSARRLLHPRGVLLVSLPSRLGIFYRAAQVASFLGVDAPLERLWQKGFPSPHLAYFAPEEFHAWVARHGFRFLWSQALPSLAWHGLWDRVSYGRGVGTAGNVLAFAAAAAMVPFLRALPPDTIFAIYERGENT